MTKMPIPLVTNDGAGASVFAQSEIELTGEMTRYLSDQIGAVNFRLRESHGYKSDYHCAGDPTLLIVLSGQIRIELVSGEDRVFKAGDLYVAQDYIQDGVAFDRTIHGHRAEQIGDTPYRAVHIKLQERL